MEDLKAAITELENAPKDWETLERLSWLYNVYDHLSGRELPQIRLVEAEGESEVAMLAQGKDPEKVWDIISDLMRTVKVIQPKMYETVIKRIEAI